MTKRDKRQGEHINELAEPTASELREFIGINERMLERRKVQGSSAWLEQRLAVCQEAIRRAEWEFETHRLQHEEAPAKIKELEARLAEQRAKLAELESKGQTKSQKIDALMARIQRGDIEALEELKVLIRG